MIAAAENDKHSFLVALANPEDRAKLVQKLSDRFAGAQVFEASDGSTALFKVENAPPQVLIMDVELPRLSGIKLCEIMLNRGLAPSTAIILRGEVPNYELIVDEIVKGKIQVLLDNYSSDEINSALGRALNYHTMRQDKNQEFLVRYLSKNEVLIHEGDKLDNLYLIRKGSLVAFVMRDQKEILLGDIHMGEFVGEMAYINGQPRSASVRATEDSEVIEIPSNLIDHLLFLKPSWSKALLKTLAKRISQSNLKKQS